ncbi:MAG TPA: hypothetical protein VK978_03895 [Candidatus Saccharimonadales bacterium]|nr:hypothetical protein [Candidatus Saccharimonadales bacterium]
MLSRLHYYADWLFQDRTVRRGKYVIAEVPNLPLVIFMACIVLGVLLNPGFLQKSLIILAYTSLTYWGHLEWRSGRSRFRKLLGILGILAVIGALLLRLGF